MKLRTKLTLITVGIVICAVLLSTFLIISFTKKNTQNTIIAAGTKDFCAFYDSFSNIVRVSVISLTSERAYSCPANVMGVDINKKSCLPVL